MQFQELLDRTHKPGPDNWTRDRGCARHGVNGCSQQCASTHRCPVPSGYTVVGVLRNQNLDLWQKYTLVRTAIAHECTRQDVHFESVGVASSAAFFPPLDPSCNEWRLFHGTGAAGARDICAQNFRLNLAGTGATWKEAGKGKGVPLYGFGLYMAERITKADEYSKSGEKEYEGIFQVILCRVAGGRTNIVQDNEINREKLSELVFDGPHHSVLGDRVTKLGKPYREIVVYDKDQIYPEFIISYARR